MKYLYRNLFISVFISYLLLNFSLLFAQTSPQDFKNKYNYGKNLIDAQRFELAADALKPVLVRHENNAFFEYAHFYYAYAVFQQKNYATTITTLKTVYAATITTLKTVLESSGNLKKHDEICYLLANALFLNNEIIEGAATTQKILNPTLRKEAANMQANFIARANNIKDLKQLYITYPNDKHISFRLWQLLTAPNYQINNQANSQINDKVLLTELQAKHTEIIKSTTPIISQTPPISNEIAIQNDTTQTVEVALLLPMLLKDTEVDKVRRKYQFVIDFYYGLLVAQEKLREEGIKTNLYLYDTEKDEQKISNILKNPTLQNADLIIGPMFPKDTPLVLDFAMANNIVLVNPLTSNADVLKKYTHAYLTEPSSEIMGSKAAKYAFNNFSDTTIIYFGNQRQDSILAYSYMQKFKELGGQVPIFKNISATKNAFHLVSADLAKYVNKPTKASVFVAAVDQNLAVNLLSGIQSNNLTVHILTTQDWLDFKQVTYEQYEQARVHFLFNSYLDYYTSAVREFDTRYIDKSNMIPSRFSYSGYDALYYFAKMLRKYGKGIRKGVEQNEKIEGLLLQGFDYRNGQDNQRLAIGVFKDGKLEISYLE